jgi:hypothetical protein
VGLQTDDDRGPWTGSSASGRLRRKIEPEPAAPRRSLTARGVGDWLAKPGQD